MPQNTAGYNPFDSENEDEDPSPDVFHDGRENHPSAGRSIVSGSTKRAHLNFNSDYGTGKTDTNPFTSPLEQAFNEVEGQILDPGNEAAELDSSIESEADDFGAHEQSPLLSTKIIPDEIFSVNPQDDYWKNSGNSRKNSLTINTRPSTGGKKSRKTRGTGSRRTRESGRSSAVQPKRCILAQLDSKQQDPELTRDYKMTRLEDLGTASSWLILLLPYIAFIVCLLLESDTSFKVTQWGPAGGATFCFGESIGETSVPILPTPPDPCIYEFNRLSSWEGSLLEIEQELSAYGMRNTTHKGGKMSRGTAFETVSWQLKLKLMASRSRHWFSFSSKTFLIGCHYFCTTIRNSVLR